MTETIDVSQGESTVWTNYRELVAGRDINSAYQLGIVLNHDGNVANRFRDRHDAELRETTSDPIFIAQVADVMVNNLGNLVLDAQDNAGGVEIVDLNQHQGNYLKGSQPAFQAEKTTVHAESAMVLMRPGDNIFGHWLLDIWPRLWLFSQSNDLHSSKFVVRASTAEFAKKMLAGLGVPDANLIIFDPNKFNLKLDQATYVSNLRKNQRVYPEMASFVDWWFDLFLGPTAAAQRPVFGERDQKPKRAFISRGRWTKPSAHRVCVNVGEIEAHLVDRTGWEIYHPQEHSLAEQLRFFSECDVLVGEEGSGMHNSLFSAGGGHVATLRNRHNHSLIQSGLCRARDQVSHAIFGATEGSGRDRNADFSVSLELVDELLDALP